MVRNLRENVEAATLPGLGDAGHTVRRRAHRPPQLVPSLSFETVKDYEDYAARLGRCRGCSLTSTPKCGKGMADGLMPPRILLDQVVAQASALAGRSREFSPSHDADAKIPKSSADDRAVAPPRRRFSRRCATACSRPTCGSRSSCATSTRRTAGRNRRWALPDGAARYAFAVRRMTTTNMAPDEIHPLGLREVARIEAEQLVIAESWASATSRRSVNPSPRFRRFTRNRARRSSTSTRLHRPDDGKVAPAFRQLAEGEARGDADRAVLEKEASTHYNQGTPDGSRPGHIFVNTYDFANQLTINNESTAYHEGMPGHHMQISIAQELRSCRRFASRPATRRTSEGWALYSERLGKEVGFYQDPYSHYGRLDDEMLRAIRLVVDTGIHGKHWTRDQVVQFFRAHSSTNEATIQSETDRYIAWPGQALAYKVGQLTILRLREEAKRRLGAKFDIRKFHDEVLGAGAAADGRARTADSFLGDEAVSQDSCSSGGNKAPILAQVALVGVGPLSCDNRMTPFYLRRRPVQRCAFAVLSIGAAIGCASSAHLPVGAVTGPTPTLSTPSTSRVPTVTSRKR